MKYLFHNIYNYFTATQKFPEFERYVQTARSSVMRR
jgi:hypothetical protein